MILKEQAQTNAGGMADGVKKPVNGGSESGSRYWGKRYIPNQGESFEVSTIPEGSSAQSLSAMTDGEYRTPRDGIQN